MRPRANQHASHKMGVRTVSNRLPELHKLVLHLKASNTIWVRYRSWTYLKGFADLHLTARPTWLVVHFCSLFTNREQMKFVNRGLIGTRTPTISSVARRSSIKLWNQLHGWRDSNSHRRFWRPECYHCTTPACVTPLRLERRTPTLKV